jgi:hypothetical protein
MTYVSPFESNDMGSTIVLLMFDNVGIWNMRSEIWTMKHFREKFYMKDDVGISTFKVDLRRTYKPWIT